jgi:hypothetical protein
MWSVGPTENLNKEENQLTEDYKKQDIFFGPILSIIKIRSPHNKKSKLIFNKNNSF